MLNKSNLKRKNKIKLICIFRFNRVIIKTQRLVVLSIRKRVLHVFIQIEDFSSNIFATYFKFCSHLLALIL